MITKEQGEALSLAIEQEAVSRFRNYALDGFDETAELRFKSRLHSWGEKNEGFILGVALGVGRGSWPNEASYFAVANIVAARFIAATLGGEE